MPELPEVEHLRRSLEPVLIDATVRDVRLHRPSVVRHLPARRWRAPLLLGASVHRLARRGKQLAVLTRDGRVLCIHLGMTGQLQFTPRGRRIPRTDHVHCVWRIDTPRGGGRLIFRDPRRFGGLWVFGSVDDLHASRWDALGPDALSLRATTLARRLGRTDRSLKAALLDQALIAGLGNIYVDEALFRARLHPLSRARVAASTGCIDLARAIRSVLRGAIDAGGSTIRDYADANGDAGAYGSQHLVYGRAGNPCVECGAPLVRLVIVQRTTVCCDACQERVS